MTNLETIDNLRKIIYDSLEPLIEGHQVILTDLPYHGNVGDILIWAGELTFLDKIDSKILAQSSSYTFQFPQLSKDVVICLHGGGNFGDLYYDAQEFRKKVITTYPDNKIIIFPQSVWYENTSLIEHDAEIFLMHKDLHLCTRDLYSYNFIKNNFKTDRIYLVPDMAFCIMDIASYGKDISNKIDKSLFVKRLDKEEVQDRFIVNEPHDERDWPYFEGKNIRDRLFFGVARRCKNIKNEKLRHCLATITDTLMSVMIKDHLIKQGVRLLKPYEKIYSTRLHAMILAILLDKNIVAFDNVTKKLSAFYNTWLTDNNSIVLKDPQCWGNINNI